jgi:hypothetical protein
MKAAEHVTAGVRHVLDPPAAEEIEAASQILRRDRGLAASAFRLAPARSLTGHWLMRG